ncbi:helix-turn-helix domain-containing protein, partial [Candidatus Mycobacterium methanotrophicum]
STHIVLPAAFQARHADTTAVIGQALLHEVNGLGYRRIAARIHRSESTVRRWLRRAAPKHLHWMYQRGAQRLIEVAPDVFGELRFVGHQLRDTLSVLCAAAYWDRHRLGLPDPPWTMVGIYTLGRLLAPPD